jgi:hypothetical protein
MFVQNMGKWRWSTVTCLFTNWGERKLLVPKLNSSMKHSNLRKCTKARHGVANGQYFCSPTNQHVKNEKLFTYIVCDTIVVQMANQGKVEKKNMFNLLQYGICCSMATLWQILKASRFYSNFWNLKNAFISIGLILQDGPWQKQCTTLFNKPSKNVCKSEIYFIELWWNQNHWQPKLVVYACLCDIFVEVDPNIVELGWLQGKVDQFWWINSP